MASTNQAYFLCSHVELSCPRLIGQAALPYAKCVFHNWAECNSPALILFRELGKCEDSFVYNHLFYAAYIISIHILRTRI